MKNTNPDSGNRSLTRRRFCKTTALSVAALPVSSVSLQAGQAKTARVGTKENRRTFTIPLQYTPRSPQPGAPFTEASFVRKSTPFTFQIAEVGIALVDLWNFGWDDGPVGKTLGSQLILERGVSHARRKRRIVEQVIAPSVEELRKSGVQIFHCTHSQILSRYPQWQNSTTEAERKALQARMERDKAAAAARDMKPQTQAQTEEKEKWPPASWTQSWREQHRDKVYNVEWQAKQNKELGGWNPTYDLPAPVRPRAEDLLVFESREQFHRLLSQRKIRVLFYMGFETDECLQFKPYGIANMQDLGYLCSVVRDATTTYETAETLSGKWKTKVTIDSIEARWGYSVTSAALRKSISAAKN